MPRIAGNPKAEAALDIERAYNNSEFGDKDSPEGRFRALGVDARRIFVEAGLPVELLAVAKVESNFNPLALSPKGAAGLWQLMPATARRYGLVVTPPLDDRLDTYKSTRAAARYLRDLYARFADWPLALAAYNAGEDAVQHAIDRTPSRDFASVAGRLPTETQNYVPAVLNAIEMMQGQRVQSISASAQNRETNVFALAKLENQK